MEFPHEAYDCQLEYMRSVVRALEHGENALLESPTGTGKTLALLCASLGWRRHRKEAAEAAKTNWEAHAEGKSFNVPNIFYSSRTHTQLKQVMKELKQTSYKPSSVILGSRQHFCLHSSVMRHSGARQNALCRRAVDEHKCPFYIGFRKCGSKVSTAVKDIEEIVESCKESTVCPYFKVREDAKDAELLLLPYDYLIGQGTRESLQVSLKNSILIFDEGHNIERSCEENASFELTQADIAGAIGELEDAFDLVEQGQVDEEVLKDMPCDAFLKLLNLVKKHLFALEDAISEEKLEKDAVTERMMRKAPGSRVLALLSKPGQRGIATEKEDLKHITQAVRRCADVLTRGQETANSGGQYLEKIQQLMMTAFQHDKEDLDKNYQMLIYEEEKKGQKRKAMDFFTTDGSRTDGHSPRRVCLWCFSCSVTMKELLKHEVHSVIITSGTLSPISSTAEAFGVPFPVVLENRHVINPRKQVFGAVLSEGPTQGSLDASFQHRNEMAYIKELGATVKRLAGSVPDGVLLAFSSYGMKDSILESWRQLGLLEEIAREKPVFEEPKGSNETKQIMEQYNAALKGSGAILAAVCRGKLCEGIDFTDKQCRMVVMVGIPYPAKNDLRVILKQDFLELQSAGNGQRWYQREAMRAVNQTLGRVIRHRHDFGAAILCDARYARRLSGLSSWLRPEVRSMTLDAAVQDCRRFFGSAASNLSGLATSAPAAATDGRVSTADGRAVAESAPAVKAKTGKEVLNLARELWRGAKSLNECLQAAPEATPLTAKALELQNAAGAAKKVATPLTGKALESRTGFQPLRPVEESEWLRSAATLLPRAEMEDLRKNLELIWIHSGDAHRDPAISSDAMSKVLEAIRECVACLMPATCFDRPEEARERERLIRRFGALLPKWLVAMYREEVKQVAARS